MNNAKALMYNSSEYKMMESRFEKIEEYTKQISKLDDPKKIPQDIARKLEDAYADLSERALIYVNLKKVLPATTIGVKRRDLAYDLMEFASDTIKEMESGQKIEVKKEEPKEIEQTNENIEL